MTAIIDDNVDVIELPTKLVQKSDVLLVTDKNGDAFLLKGLASRIEYLISGLQWMRNLLRFAK